MDLKTPTLSGDTTLMFADCAVMPCPTAEELVDIAHATALSYRKLIGKAPKVAFLSFSTKEYIKDFAAKVVSGEFDLAAVAKMPDEEVIAALSRWLGSEGQHDVRRASGQGRCKLRQL